MDVTFDRFRWGGRRSSPGGRTPGPAPGWLVLSLFALAAGCGVERYPLVELVGEAERDYRLGAYAHFVDAAVDVETVTIDGDARVSLTPPFPARLTFDVDGPPSGFLRFAPAIVMNESVRRARVEFVVEVESSLGTTEIYRELFRLNEANRWHGRSVSLGSWSGERVRIHLRTTIADGRDQALWTDRLRAVWGEPVVASNRLRQYGAIAGGWLAATANRFGVSPEDVERAWRFALNLVLGGLLALAVRALFLRFGSSSSSHDFADMFPMFTLVTIVVIAVVQSSLALSLGLIGALSIVRFRTAIKTPEELAYLLFCVAVGLALGAGRPLLAMISVLVVSAAVAAWRLGYRRAYERNLMLTVSGDAERFFGSGGGTAVELVREITERFRFQRLDQTGERVELRGVVTVDTDDAESLLTRLRERLPELQFSYVDVDDIL